MTVSEIIPWYVHLIPTLAFLIKVLAAYAVYSSIRAIVVLADATGSGMNAFVAYSFILLLVTSAVVCLYIVTEPIETDLVDSVSECVVTDVYQMTDYSAEVNKPYITQNIVDKMLLR